MMIMSPRFVLLFLFALVLTILPLPAQLSLCRPAWILLIALYVQYWMPAYFRVWWIFLLGLSLDSLLATPLGEHSAALLLTTWFATSKARRFCFFSTAQQMVFVLFFCFCYQGTIYLIDASLGYDVGFLFVVIKSLTGMLIWPWFRQLANHLFYPLQRSRS